MLLSKATYNTSYKHSLMAVAAMQFGVQYLTQGQSNMQTRGTEPATLP